MHLKQNPFSVRCLQSPACASSSAPVAPLLLATRAFLPSPKCTAFSPPRCPPRNCAWDAHPRSREAGISSPRRDPFSIAQAQPWVQSSAAPSLSMAGRCPLFPLLLCSGLCRSLGVSSWTSYFRCASVFSVTTHRCWSGSVGKCV